MSGDKGIQVLQLGAQDVSHHGRGVLLHAFLHATASPGKVSEVERGETLQVRQKLSALA